MKNTTDRYRKIAKAVAAIPLVRSKPIEIPEIKPIYPGWNVLNCYTGNPESPFPTSCILVIPGRGQSGFQFAKWYQYSMLHNTMIIGITPQNREWYPMPNGPFDQKDAIRGLVPSAKAIEKVLEDIENYFNFKPEEIALAGYSAGAVIALETLTHSKHRFASIVCHAGAILDPDQFPDAPNDTPIHLIHSVDDTTFDWNERYVPMKMALLEKGYNVTFTEKPSGGHGIQYPDILLSGTFLQSHFPDYDANYLTKVWAKMKSFYNK